MNCQICGRPIYGYVCDECISIVKNVKHLKDNAEKVFNSNFDCYADIEEESCVLAMTFDKFQEIVDNL